VRSLIAKGVFIYTEEVTKTKGESAVERWYGRGKRRWRTRELNLIQIVPSFTSNATRYDKKNSAEGTGL